jgi:hypothetical protein
VPEAAAGAKPEIGKVEMQPIPAGLPPAQPEPLTRLVLIDAGLDPAALRAKYPNPAKVMILPARANLWLWEVKGEKRLQGSIVNLEPRSIHVPQPVAGSFPKRLGPTPSQAEAGKEPRFRMKMRVGSGYAPMVQGIIWEIPEIGAKAGKPETPAQK